MKYRTYKILAGLFLAVLGLTLGLSLFRSADIPSQVIGAVLGVGLVSLGVDNLHNAFRKEEEKK